MKIYKLLSIVLCLLVWQEATATIAVQSTTNTSYHNTCDGSIDIIATGTAGPFTFIWSNGATTEDVSNLCPGTYQVAVTNAYGCTRLLENIKVAAPLSLGLGTQVVMGNNCTSASICLNVVGGVEPFSLNWSDGSEGGSFCRSVATGTYSVTITDGAGQTVVAGPYTVTGATPLSIVSNITPSCSGQSTGHIDLTVTGGNQPLTYSWANGSTSTDGDIGGLLPHTYTVTITDATGCQQMRDFTVGEYDGFDLNPIVTEACEITEDGAIVFTPSGGLEPYTYLWNSGVFGGAANGTGTTTVGALYDLAPNTTHSVTVTDASGCETTGTYNVGLSPSNPVTNTSTNPQLCQEEVWCKGTLVEVTPRATEDFDAYRIYGAGLWNPLPYVCKINGHCPLNGGFNYEIQGSLVSYYSGGPSTTTPSSLGDFFCHKLVDCSATGSDGTPYFEGWEYSRDMTTQHIGDDCYEVFCGGYNIGQFCNLYARVRPNSEPHGDIVLGPNPFYSKIRIMFINNTSENVDLALMDITGKMVFTKKIQIEQGSSQVIVNLENNLPKGVYNLVLTYDDGAFTTRKLVH